MFILENSNFEIYTEYLRYKYKDESIKVIQEGLSNSTDNTYVYYSDSTTNKDYKFAAIPYNDLLVMIRIMKLKRLKEKICQ